MKFFKQICFTNFPAIVLVAAAIAMVTLQAQAQNEKSAPQRQFATPEDAVKALRDAAKAGDRAAMHEIFGPRIHEVMTGDEVQDRTNFAAFSRTVEESCKPEPDGEGRVVLNIGAENWPFPIPLVKTNGQWVFDTDAGIEEIINRHVGRGELNAIAVCRDYVEAQKKYFSADRDGSGVRNYAQKFKSAPGKKDGLYWETGANEEASPFGLLVAEAHQEGYGSSTNTGLHAYHGYIFHVLKAQGSAAPGGRMSYLENGNLTKGFALVAYPERWGKSGIMTFIVNQDGKVYQRNFGNDTGRVASRITEYNPDRKWKLEEDTGIAEK
jgi:hypothetical protein